MNTIPPMNAAQTLLEAGAAQAIALECGDERLSYADLRARVRQSAGSWRALGLQPGERVVVLAPDSIDWVVAYLGIIWAGGVAIGVNPRLSAAELGPILQESDVRFVWHEADSQVVLASLVAAMDPAPVLVASGAQNSFWCRALAQADPIEPLPVSYTHLTLPTSDLV